MSLEQKKVVVVGGSSGIGYAAAELSKAIIAGDVGSDGFDVERLGREFKALARKAQKS